MGINTVQILAFVLVVISLILSLYRLWRGPSHFDRVLALESTGLCFIAVILFYTMIFGEHDFIDVILVFSFWSFLATIFTAIFLEEAIRE